MAFTSTQSEGQNPNSKTKAANLTNQASKTYREHSAQKPVGDRSDVMDGHNQAIRYSQAEASEHHTQASEPSRNSKLWRQRSNSSSTAQSKTTGAPTPSPATIPSTPAPSCSSRTSYRSTTRPSFLEAKQSSFRRRRRLSLSPPGNGRPCTALPVKSTDSIVVLYAIARE